MTSHTANRVFNFLVVSTGDTGLGLGRVNHVCVVIEYSERPPRFSSHLIDTA
jgi:hypothetical protein